MSPVVSTEYSPGEVYHTRRDRSPYRPDEKEAPSPSAPAPRLEGARAALLRWSKVKGPWSVEEAEARLRAVDNGFTPSETSAALGSALGAGDYQRDVEGRWRLKLSQLASEPEREAAP